MENCLKGVDYPICTSETRHQFQIPIRRVRQNEKRERNWRSDVMLGFQSKVFKGYKSQSTVRFVISRITIGVVTALPLMLLLLRQPFSQHPASASSPT